MGSEIVGECQLDTPLYLVRCIDVAGACGMVWTLIVAGYLTLLPVVGHHAAHARMLTFVSAFGVSDLP